MLAHAVMRVAPCNGACASVQGPDAVAAPVERLALDQALTKLVHGLLTLNRSGVCTETCYLMQ